MQLAYKHQSMVLACGLGSLICPSTQASFRNIYGLFKRSPVMLPGFSYEPAPLSQLKQLKLLRDAVNHGFYLQPFKLIFDVFVIKSSLRCDSNWSMTEARVIGKRQIIQWRTVIIRAASLYFMQRRLTRERATTAGKQSSRHVSASVMMHRERWESARIGSQLLKHVRL